MSLGFKAGCWDMQSRKCYPKCKRDKKLNLLWALREMRRDGGVWSTHLSCTIFSPHQKLFFSTGTHTYTHLSWSKYPESIAAQGHLSLHWHSACVPQFSLISCILALNVVIQHKPEWDNNSLYMHFKLRKVLILPFSFAHCIANRAVGFFSSSSQHCVTCCLNILYVLRINPDLMKALQYNFLKISFPSHVKKKSKSVRIISTQVSNCTAMSFALECHWGGDCYMK